VKAIPSVALFGLLIAPLAGVARYFPALGELGVSGTGVCCRPVTTPRTSGSSAYNVRAIRAGATPVPETPSSLFGLLIAPLAGVARYFPALGELGVSGTGVAPALIPARPAPENSAPHRQAGQSAGRTAPPTG
jgi:hypothetical protein